jgi:hypothetical protein
MSRYILKLNLDCKKINLLQKDLLEHVVLTGVNLSNNNQNNYTNTNSYNTNHNPNSKLSNNLMSPQREAKDDRKSTLSLDRKTDKKNLPANNNFNDGSLKKSCICHTNYNENVIKNNICSICNRYVENTNLNENTIKKRYQQQDANRPR